jgi:hypothetical protein
MNTFHVYVQFLSYLHVKSWACAQAQIVWHRGITKKSDRKISTPQVILFYIIKRELNWPSPYCLAILCLIPQVPGVTVEWPSKKRQTCDLMKCDKCVNIEELVLHLMQEWVPSRRRWRLGEFGGLAEFFLPLPRVDRIFFQKRRIAN